MKTNKNTKRIKMNREDMARKLYIIEIEEMLERVNDLTTIIFIHSFLTRNEKTPMKWDNFKKELN